MKRYFAGKRGIISVVAVMALVGTAAAQQTYPSKAIRIITPYAPGAGTDTAARIVGQRMTEIWGQQAVVDNRPGGNTMIGTDAVAKSPPDGYTLLVVNSALVTTPLLFPAPYDPIKDFAAIATMTSTELVLVLHPSVPANNLQEFIALAKSKPGQLNFASAGSGSATHLAAELLGIMAGIKMQHIPYKGGTQVMTDLIGGQVQVLFGSPLTVVPQIKSGRIKPIAYSDSTRLPALPQVPTFAEAGLPGFGAKTWHGILAPAGTPKAIIDKLSTEIARSMTMPGIKEKLATQGLDIYITTPEQFAALLKADMARFAKIIKAADIKREQ